jgi:hypothetical protein
MLHGLHYTTRPLIHNKEGIKRRVGVSIKKMPVGAFTVD